jgi:hypothetical protein
MRNLYNWYLQSTEAKLIPSSYCHVCQWLRREFWLVNGFIGTSLVKTTVSSYTLKITVTIAHVTSHTKSSSGHTAVPLELKELKWSQFAFPYSLISSRHGPRTENTIPLLRSADHTENKLRDNYLASPLVSWVLPNNETFVLLLSARIAGCLSSRFLAKHWHVTIFFFKWGQSLCR